MQGIVAQCVLKATYSGTQDQYLGHSECALNVLAPFNEFLGSFRGANQHLECKADLS